MIKFCPRLNFLESITGETKWLSSHLKLDLSDATVHPKNDVHKSLTWQAIISCIWNSVFQVESGPKEKSISNLKEIMRYKIKLEDVNGGHV